MNPKERETLKSIHRMANPEERERYLRLDKNERLTPLSRKFFAKYKSGLTPLLMGMYPEVEETRIAVARAAGVPGKNIVLSHGSDAAIKQVFDVFARQNSEVVLLQPTYAMYPIYITTSGARARGIQCNASFEFDEKELLQSIGAKTSMVAIANPNSPTGSQFSKEFLFKCLKRCQRFGAVLLVDEAYYYFSKTTMMPYVAREDNLVVMRTFSKALGLAGCRAGFVASSSNLLTSIGKARPLYEINALTALAIRVCLESMDEVGQYVKEMEKGKKYLFKVCREMGLKPFPTFTNFVNIRLPEFLNARELEAFARRRGILFKGDIGGGAFHNCIRITLGPEKQMKTFLAVLKEFAGESGG